MAKDSKKGGYKGPLYDTGPVAIQLYSNLLRDFRTIEGAGFMADTEFDLMSNIAKFRAKQSIEPGIVRVGLFKRIKQVESLLKKFRFSTDNFTDDELSEISLDNFIKTQVRLHTCEPLKFSGFTVLQRARKIARRILGDFPSDEVINNVRFGKKSSIGCPLSLAYIDNKLSMVDAFTGTSPTSEFFLNQVLPGDHILQRILANHDFESLKKQLNMGHLNLVEVPKTWKTYRLITPLTLLGLFYSYGIGRIVTDRLRKSGLDIAKLQQTHRELVKGFSVSRTHATADLSEASDSITSELLNRILPRAWYNALKKTFVRSLKTDRGVISSVSVLPMGNGATFPVETLVFYSLIKAIGELMSVEGTYSVYGDDLIYPSKIHKVVAAVFPQLKLKLNLDKTFVTYPFRESCGSDFYRGQDVRPYFLRGEQCKLSRARYEAFLYKVYNGLVARWHPLEIRGTLTWVLSELAMISHGILRVPPSYPDFSGVKVSSLLDIPLDYSLLPWKPIVAKFYDGSKWFQFDFLTETPKRRVVTMTEPYYWLALQGLADEVVIDEYSRKLRHMRSVEFFAKWGFKEAPASSLSWKKVCKKLKPYYHKGKQIVKRQTTFTPVVDSRSGSAVSTSTTKTNSISYWI